MTRSVILAPMLVAATTTAPVFAEVDTRDSEIAELRSMVEMLQSEVEVLRSETDTNWMTQQRTEQIRGLVQDVLSDADTRESLQGDGAMSGYNKGFYVQSADGNYSLKINGQLQARWLYNHTVAGTSHGFEQRRAKLKFSGNVIDKSWGYKFTIVMPRDNSNDTDDDSGMYLEDAWISKKLNNGWSIKVGQRKAPFLREEMVSSTRQLAVERSMVSNAFTYGWTQGFLLNYSADNMNLAAWYGDGPNTLNSQAFGEDTHAFTARGEFLLAGDWSQFKGFNATPTEGMGVMLGAAVAYMDGDTATNIGNVNADKNTQYTIDISFANAGWTVFGYYVHSSGENGGIEVADSSGWVTQAGYMINDKTEIFGRYEGGGIDGLPAADMGAMTVGFNYWPTGNSNVKWTTDIGWALDPVSNTTVGTSNPDWISSGNGWTADATDGEYLIRTQLQILF